MTKWYLLGCLFLLASCASQSTKQDKEIGLLTEWMTGEFSSQEQAEQDSAFFSINLAMYPIWQNNKEANWLYVEQAVSSMLDKPYRQRVYRIAYASDGSIESRVYELPDPSRFIQADSQSDLFKGLTPDSLLERSGCSVFLKKADNNCFKGSTKEKACQSTLRGASYATSEVQICPGQIVSWDQGWNDTDEQVWGAVKGGYIFKKIR